MHELSIATAIVDRAEELARQHSVRAVSAVRVRVGEIAGVVSDALQFSFDIAREGTVAGAARLIVEDVPARARCEACDADFAVGTPPFLWCPTCDRPASRLLSGRELEITAIEFEEAAG